MPDDSPPRDRHSRRALFGSGFGRALNAQLASRDEICPSPRSPSRASASATEPGATTDVPGRRPAPAPANAPGGQGPPTASR